MNARSRQFEFDRPLVVTREVLLAVVEEEREKERRADARECAEIKARLAPYLWFPN